MVIDFVILDLQKIIFLYSPRLQLMIQYNI